MTYYPFAPMTGDHYILTAPSGSVAVFNDPLDPNYVGMLSEVTGLDSAEIRETADDLVQQDGGVHGDFWLGRRPITMTGAIFNVTASERTLRIDRLMRASMALRGDGTLTWKPAVRKENQANNPAFNVGTSGWAGVNGTLSQNTTWGTQGRTANRSARVTGSIAASGGFMGIEQGYVTAAVRKPAYAGQSWTLRFDANIITNASHLTAQITFFDAAGATLSSADVITNQIGTGVKAGLSGTATAPANTVAAGILIYMRNNTAGAITGDFYIDGVVFAPTLVAGTGYFDGDTTGYHWQGPQDSTAADHIQLYTTVRRQQPLRTSGGWAKDFQLALVSEYATLMALGSQSLTGNGTAENRGSYPAAPKFRITGVAGGVTGVHTITVVNGGVTTGVLKVGSAGAYLNLTAGQYLEIDTFTHQAVYYDGATLTSGNRFIDFVGTTTWPTFNTGNNTVTMAATSGTLGTLTTTWRDTWA